MIEAQQRNIDLEPELTAAPIAPAPTILRNELAANVRCSEPHAGAASRCLETIASALLTVGVAGPRRVALYRVIRGVR